MEVEKKRQAGRDRRRQLRRCQAADRVAKGDRRVGDGSQDDTIGNDPAPDRARTRQCVRAWAVPGLFPDAAKEAMTGVKELRPDRNRPDARLGWPHLRHRLTWDISPSAKAFCAVQVSIFA